MGAQAEYCVTPASGATLLPDNVPFDESAILGCALFTAFGALRNSADLREGETLAVVGCGGIGELPRFVWCTAELMSEFPR